MRMAAELRLTGLGGVFAGAVEKDPSAAVCLGQILTKPPLRVPDGPMLSSYSCAAKT